MIAGLRTRLRRWRSKPAAATGFAHAGQVGTLERIEGAPLPVVRIFGWWAGDVLPPFALDTDHRACIPATVASRMRRPDVQASGASADAFAGFRADFLLAPGETPARLRLGDTVLHAFRGDEGHGAIDPHYRHFFTQDRVMGRSAVYGSGPPTNVSDEFKAFTLRANGRVLDFGCGNGDVVLALHAQGRDATGIELDEPRIRDALKPGAAPHVVLYGGGIPLPFEAGAFDWIVSTEVIEHVPDIARYIPEFRRLLRPGGRVLVTTPDITSIPSSFPANCVPWHLLESTHVNFFTPASVATLFAPHFDLDATYCLGATRINGLFVPGSIGAVFRKAATT